MPANKLPDTIGVSDPTLALKSAIMAQVDELETALAAKLKAEHTLLKAQHLLDTERIKWEGDQQIAADEGKATLAQIAFGLREINPKATETFLTTLLFVTPEATRERHRAADFDLQMHGDLYYKECDLHEAKLAYYEACNAVELARARAKSLDWLVRLECLPSA